MQRDGLLQRIGARLGGFLERDKPASPVHIAQDFTALAASLRVGDVLLVEGRAKVSAAIRYATQSTWSHAALCVQDAAGGGCELVEVTLRDGCHRIRLARYAGYNTRICRPASLTAAERQAVADYMIAQIGIQYDMRNIFDLVRYLLPVPPVPARFRRRMLALGSGDPTRAICSSLVARAFQSVRYPVLPRISYVRASRASRSQRRELWHIRHHSLYVPRDFDLSPYFQVIKPTLEAGFDHRGIRWAASDAGLGMG